MNSEFWLLSQAVFYFKKPFFLHETFYFYSQQKFKCYTSLHIRKTRNGATKHKHMEIYVGVSQGRKNLQKKCLNFKFLVYSGEGKCNLLIMAWSKYIMKKKVLFC